MMAADAGRIFDPELFGRFRDILPQVVGSAGVLALAGSNANFSCVTPG
jgi:hypothetical protein